MLAVVFTLDKFHQYTCGRRIEIHTDHKPLEAMVRKSLIKVSTGNVTMDPKIQHSHSICPGKAYVHWIHAIMATFDGWEELLNRVWPCEYGQHPFKVNEYASLSVCKTSPIAHRYWWISTMIQKVQAKYCDHHAHNLPVLIEGDVVQMHLLSLLFLSN